MQDKGTIRQLRAVAFAITQSRAMTTIVLHYSILHSALHCTAVHVRITLDTLTKYHPEPQYSTIALEQF